MSDVIEPVLSVEVIPPNVRELHVDFLLEEEFSVNRQFVGEFVNAAGLDPTSIEVEYVRHSVSDQFGEADLIVVYKAEGNKRIALLIEDKIRAEFQIDQALRYERRGEDGIPTEWHEYRTCLVASESYIERGHDFHVAIPLEKIKHWLAVDEPTRHQFKAHIIEQAIKKARTTGVNMPDVQMTRFRVDYYQFAKGFFDRAQMTVRMRPPAKETYKSDTWFRIWSDVLPKRAYIDHKSERGMVDLTFRDTVAELLTDVQKYLEPNMRIEQTGKSAAIRLEVPIIDRFDDFRASEDRVRQALTAIVQLTNFYNRERASINPILSRARRPAALQEDAASA